MAPALSTSSPEPAGESERGGIQVIARAAAILRVLKDHPGGLSLGEIAKLLKLPRSTVQRIVEALDAENLVMAASPQRGVRLGPALLPLAAAARFEPAELLKPMLEAVSRESGETVNLSILDGSKLVFIEQIVGSHLLRTAAAVGVSFPLHSTASGKAILAALDGPALAALRPRLRLAPLTPHTLTSWDALAAQLASVRSTQLAYDLEENALGICGVGTALRLRSGELAAVSVPVPTQRFNDMRSTLEALLLQQRERWQRLLAA